MIFQKLFDFAYDHCRNDKYRKVVGREGRERQGMFQNRKLLKNSKSFLNLELCFRCILLSNESEIKCAILLKI